MAKQKKYKFRLSSHRLIVVADKILLIRLLRSLNGRFWGVFGLFVLYVSLAICFSIRPELRVWSTAFSDFGTDIKTTTIFSFGLFVCGYGLWRWRNYLVQSSKTTGLVLISLTAIIIGAYLVALMPININDRIDDLHYFGFFLGGGGMIATVMVDMLLRKVKKGGNRMYWQLLRFVSLLLIVAGLVVTLLSHQRFGGKMDHALLGELLVLSGFGLWVVIRTIQGEGVKTNFSRVLGKVLIVD